MAWLGMLLSAIISGAIGLSQSFINKKSQEQANETNLDIARETNAANVEQAQLAYQRSLPVNQVRNLMDAGMSRAGALSSLTGGGTYTAPVLQSARVDAPQHDFSGLMSAVERLGNIPSNVEQYNLVQKQRDALETDTRIKEEQNRREEEKHEMEMWTMTYGKKSAEMIDALSSEIVSMAADKGISLDGIDTIDGLVRAFDLGKNEIWRNMPHAARTQVLEAVRTQHAENRARQSQENENRRSLDVHDLAVLDKTLKSLQISEQEQGMIHRLAILANQVSLSNNELKQSDMDRIIREAGFENEKEAAEALRAAENLYARAERNRARTHNLASSGYISEGIMSIEWLLDKVNPIKNLLHVSTK